MRFLNSVLLVALAHSAAAAIAPRSATADATSAAVETEAVAAETATEVASETGTEAAAEVVACKSIAELALADEEGRFSTLVELVLAAGLVDRFNNTDGSFGNVTVFAPINDAFAGLNASALTPADIFSTLSLHVVPGAVLSSSLTDGQKVEPFVLGEQLTIGVGETGVTVNNANVIIADLEACNGVVHVIDQIITSSEATETAPEATATETPVEETESPAETETETAEETADAEATTSA